VKKERTTEDPKSLKKNLKAMLVVAVLGGLFFGVVTFFTNLFVLAFCAAFDADVKHGWLANYIQIQDVPFGFFLHLTGLEHFRWVKPGLILVSISNGFWLMLIIFVFGCILRLAAKVAERINPDSVK
jgi:hypothetical protein